MKSGIGFMLMLVAIVATGAARAADLLIENARLHTLGPLGTIERGSILIEAGKIVAVGEQLSAAGAQVIDASGMQVTPGLMDAQTQLGLVEISGVSASVDYITEDHKFGPSFTIAEALNPWSTLIPYNRAHGLLRAIVAPLSGHEVFAGQGAAIRLGSPENFVSDASVAVFASIGGANSQFAGGSRAAAFASLRRALLDAQDFAGHRELVYAGKWRDYSRSIYDLDALVPLLSGEKVLVVNAHRRSDLLALIGLKKEFQLRMVIAGASEAWLLAEELAQAQVPVIIDPMANVPVDFDQLGARLDAAARLARAGVTVMFSAPGFMNTSSAHLVRQGAGNAAAYGMPVEVALKAMTLNPATVFGFADRFGTIEPGKDADLVVWDGDPLELLTSAHKVIVEGRLMPMVSRASRLRDRYRVLDTDLPHAYRK
jgi:imidazolonepropionase-like amidohydrolase